MTTRTKPWFRRVAALVPVLLIGGVTLTGCNLGGADDENDNGNSQQQNGNNRGDSDDDNRGGDSDDDNDNDANDDD